jgi:hypothetical protein
MKVHDFLHVCIRTPLPHAVFTFHHSPPSFPALYVNRCIPAVIGDVVLLLLLLFVLLAGVGWVSEASRGGFGSACPRVVNANDGVGCVCIPKGTVPIPTRHISSR